jgi:hypothetical protein
MSVEDMLNENKILCMELGLDSDKYSAGVYQFRKNLILSICEKREWRCVDLIGENCDAASRRDALCIDLVIREQIDINKSGIRRIDCIIYFNLLTFLNFRVSSCSYW